MRTNLSSAALVAVLAAGLAACASSTAVGNRGESLSMFEPADQTLRRGDINRVSVVVRRNDLPDGVDLDVANLPEGVEVLGGPPRIAPGSNFGEFTLYARPDADLVSGHAVQVTARAPAGVAVSQWFHVTVRPD